MKKLIYITIFLATVVTYNKNTLFAQGIGINETGASPDPSAGLDVDFNNKGMLGPRLTTAQRNSISSPAIGLQIFNLDTDCIEVYFANGGWKAIECGCTSFPDATFPNPGGGANVPVNFDANTVVSTNTYNWIFDQGTPSSSADTSETVTWTTADTYEVTLIVSDENNCVSTHTENVVIVPCASFPDATFTGSNGSINSPIAFSANGSGAGYTYDWTFPSGTPSTSTQQNPSVEWATDGTYTVELTVTDNLSCSASETMEVTVDLCTPDGPWNFTNASATGRFGPSQSQVNSAYSGSNLDGDVTSNSGIQEWTVPSSGTYRITAVGAGADARQGGSGAGIQGDFSLTAGEEIWILVGQRPEPFNSGNGSGAGGSFVVRAPYNTNASILTIAGGGGGGHNNGIQVNSHGQSNNNGGSGTIGVAGGTNGNGGNGQNSSGGAGFIGNGQAGSISGTVPSSFINGGTGGIYGSNQGGFGGGGHLGNSHGAGGGGYSGGGGTGSSPWHGGGGGSYNNGTNQTNTSGANSGHGYVTIEKICP